MSEKVLNFISRFTCRGRFEQVVESFTHGCCWWFAYILNSRFQEYDPVIMYDEVMNHFGTKINGRVYDASGDVTKEFDWKPWSEFPDPLVKERIEKHCIMFDK